MGEWSRTVGEHGEKTVENFLGLIGWKGAQSNLQFSCVNSKDHSNDGERLTHGIDFYYSYRSPLMDGCLKNVHISVKFTSNKYPTYPSSRFKSYFEDLVFGIECFSISELKRSYSSQIGGIEVVDNIGVLFWLSNAADGDDEIISKVAGAQTTISKSVQSVLVVDNKRVDFIYRAIKFAKNLMANSNIDFYYPSTGKNISPVVKRNYGKELPVEYINSSLLPIRIEEQNGNVHLALFAIDPFETGDLKRLMGLTQDLCGSWTSSIIILFPDYNDLVHKNDVRAAQSSFENKMIVDRLKVMSYNDSFKSL